MISGRPMFRPIFRQFVAIEVTAFDRPFQCPANFAVWLSRIAHGAEALDRPQHRQPAFRCNCKNSSCPSALARARSVPHRGGAHAPGTQAPARSQRRALPSRCNRSSWRIALVLAAALSIDDRRNGLIDRGELVRKLALLREHRRLDVNSAGGAGSGDKLPAKQLFRFFGNAERLGRLLRRRDVQLTPLPKPVFGNLV